MIGFERCGGLFGGRLFGRWVATWFSMRVFRNPKVAWHWAKTMSKEFIGIYPLAILEFVVLGLSDYLGSRERWWLEFLAVLAILCFFAMPVAYLILGFRWVVWG